MKITNKQKIFKLLLEKPMTRFDIINSLWHINRNSIENAIPQLEASGYISVVAKVPKIMPNGVGTKLINVYKANDSYTIEDLKSEYNPKLKNNGLKKQGYVFSDNQFVVWHSLEDAKKINGGRGNLKSAKLSPEKRKELILLHNPLFIMYEKG